MTVATKSGTNQLHGSVFNFLRNNRMDANNFFSNRSGQKLGTFQRNEFWLGSSIHPESLIRVQDPSNGTLAVRRRDQAGTLRSEWNAKVASISKFA